MEGRIEELDITQKIMLELFNDRRKDSWTTTPIIHCCPAVRISISVFHLGDFGLIPNNGMLCSYFFLFYSFIFCHQLYLSFTYRGTNGKVQ